MKRFQREIKFRKDLEAEAKAEAEARALAKKKAAAKKKWVLFGILATNFLKLFKSKLICPGRSS